MRDALTLASEAARIAVSKVGTVAVGHEELVSSLTHA
jgi:bifunctional ADP-heptose synthase (sugar kinase/adenylyltransferase)